MAQDARTAILFTRKQALAIIDRLAQVPLGGSAVGTGLNTHPEFASRVRRRLEVTGAARPSAR